MSDLPKRTSKCLTREDILAMPDAPVGERSRDIPLTSAQEADLEGSLASVYHANITDWTDREWHRALPDWSQLMGRIEPVSRVIARETIRSIESAKKGQKRAEASANALAAAVEELRQEVRSLGERNHELAARLAAAQAPSSEHADERHTPEPPSNSTEWLLLKAMRATPTRGEAVAALAEVPFNSYTKACLASLRKQGLCQLHGGPHGGYFVAAKSGAKS